MSLVQKHVETFLGKVCKDKITGIQGTVTTICFDLYGCIQAALHPGVDKDNKPLETHWYDISRLKILGDSEMSCPDFNSGQIAEGLKGSAEKPLAKQ